MSRHYSDPTRANDRWALPDVEVFYMTADDIADTGDGSLFYDGDDEPREPGWYFWYCFPGCMPDSDPFGPFDTEAEAVEAAQEASCE